VAGEVAVLAASQQKMAATAAQASSSFPMLAHNNFLVVLSLQLAATPFTHSRLLALLAQSQRCLRLI
jgi:hypothetical protein